MNNTENKTIKLAERINEWHKEHTFLSSVLASIIASMILGIGGVVFGYIFAVKPINDLRSDMNSIYISLNNKITSIANNNTTNNGDNNSYINNENNDNNQDSNNVTNDSNNNNNNNNNNTYNYYYYFNENSVDSEFINSVINTFDYNSNLVSLSYGKYDSFNTSQIVATDDVTKQVYTVGSTQGEIIILHYVEKGEDVFFKGKFDENGRWDDNCVINRYSNGKLISIMDAEYDAGELLSYKLVFSYNKYNKEISEDNYDVWAISERNVEDGDNKSGFTWTYFKKDDFIQQFETDLVSDTDILNIEDFKNSFLNIDLLREGYYNGYTSNGKYNDETGYAYLVKYNEYGYVRYLYVGKITDGQPNDNTGNAWCISLGHDNTNYYYYKGTINNGDIKGKWEKKSIQEVKAIVNIEDYNCELSWFESI